VVNTTFNNISVISWQSVLLVEKTRVPGEKQVTDYKTNSPIHLQHTVNCNLNFFSIQLFDFFLVLIDSKFYYISLLNVKLKERIEFFFFYECMTIFSAFYVQWKNTITNLKKFSPPLKFSQGDFLKISQKFYRHYKTRGWGLIVVNTTFNNISVISWQSVLLERANLLKSNETREEIIYMHDFRRKTL
jgi:hypothetical protein